MNKLHKTLLTISRIFIGVIFIYSGFVKSIDPLGFTYKLTDYFIAFGTEWATPLSFFLSVTLSLTEFVIGVALLLNLKAKQAILGALLFMLFFTPLTFILAINNPVHDCGCFGDALILTNWQTFGKNIIILIPVVYVFIVRKKIVSNLHCIEQWAGVGIATIFIGFLSAYSYYHLPIIDFRPYKVGTYIPEKMTIPENAPVDEWESTFIYKKDGVKKEFKINNLPDSTWVFVDSKNILVKNGYTPPIHDFIITTAEGDDITDLLLASKNYTFLLISYKLDGYSYKNQQKIDKLIQFCIDRGYNFYGITSSSNSDIDSYLESTQNDFDFYGADEITLKTIIRSNPGLVLIKSGAIINKWHNNDIPCTSELEENINAQTISEYKKSSDNYYILLLISASGLMISLYLLIRKSIFKIN